MVLFMGISLAVIVVILIITISLFIIKISYSKKELLIAKESLGILEFENKQLVEENNKLRDSNARFDEKNKLLVDNINNLDNLKNKILDDTKKTVLESSNNLTKNLIEQYKQELKGVNENALDNTKSATKEIHETFNRVMSQIKSFSDDNTSVKNEMNIMKSAMTAPNSVGKASEIILENTLKAFGLEEGRDYSVQKEISLSGNKLRPDAVVFLPNGSGLVIDSKSSKHIYDLASATVNEDVYAITNAEDKFKKTMNEHLKSLATKDYQSAVKKEYTDAGKADEMKNINTIMWLPDDGAVEKIRRIDPSFIANAAHKNIYVCGPSGLWMSIGIANNAINLDRKLNEHQKILQETEVILRNIGLMAEKGNKVGKSLQAMQNGWGDFLKTFNKGFINSAVRIEKMGVKSPKEIKQIHDINSNQNTNNNVIDEKETLINE